MDMPDKHTADVINANLITRLGTQQQWTLWHVQMPQYLGWQS